MALIETQVKVVQQRDRTTVGVQMNVLEDQQMDLVAGRQQWTEGEGTVLIAEQM